MRIVQLMMVRDEMDVIGRNIAWHLARGVEAVIVTDNGSVDGTRELLEELSRGGRVRLLKNDKPFRQGEIVTEMAKMARTDFGADWIIPGDADEFWTPASGDLRTGLADTPDNIHAVRVVNFVPTELDSEEGDPVMRLTFKVSRPPAIPKIPYLLKRIQGKVMFKAADFKRVLDGNHKVESSPSRKGRSTNVVIYHYPVRSLQQFTRKVVAGGRAIAGLPDAAPDLHYHWRRWYAKYEAKQLDREWRRLRLGGGRLAALRLLGVVERDRTIADAFAPDGTVLHPVSLQPLERGIRTEVTARNA